MRNASQHVELPFVQQNAAATHTKPVVVGKEGINERLARSTSGVNGNERATASIIIAKSPGRPVLTLGEQRPLDRLPKTVAIDESGAQSSSSDGSAKPPSIDGKSTTSGTTFALDEKESLRPDDSASTRAALDEEDISSAPGSVVAGSRVGSDHGARAFSDQLHEISAMGSLAQRDCLPVRSHPSTRLTQNGIIGIIPMTHGLAQPSPSIAPDAMQAIPGVVAVPDEKLLEALRSPKDRVWVLKLEQDVNDFMRSKTYVSIHFYSRNFTHRLYQGGQAFYTAVQLLLQDARAPACRLLYARTHSRQFDDVCADIQNSPLQIVGMHLTHSCQSCC